MNLKEAFHYQNTLNGFLHSASAYLMSPQNMVRVQQTHMRNAADPSASDETIDATKERPYPCSNNVMIGLLAALLEERKALAQAIQRAKSLSSFMLDAELSANRSRQDVVQALQTVSRIKPSERMTYANGYKFNNEGNQVPYRYDVKEVTTIDFDRNFVRDLMRKYQQEANEISNKADHCMIDTELEGFIPMFDPDGSFDDIVEVYDVLASGRNNESRLTAEQAAYEARAAKHAV